MDSAPRYVACPTCKGRSLYASGNRYRPFCSERCRAIDLGAWASESYRIEADTQTSDERPGDGGEGEAQPDKGRRT